MSLEGRKARLLKYQSRITTKGQSLPKQISEADVKQMEQELEQDLTPSAEEIPEEPEEKDEETA